MGSNKNLIDDQLEPMFKATDDEMQQIWATNGVFDWKNQTQMQEVYQMFLKRSCAQAAPVWTSNQKGEMPPLQ